MADNDSLFVDSLHTLKPYIPATHFISISLVEPWDGLPWIFLFFYSGWFSFLIFIYVCCNVSIYIVWKT